MNVIGRAIKRWEYMKRAAAFVEWLQVPTTFSFCKSATVDSYRVRISDDAKEVGPREYEVPIDISGYEGDVIGLHLMLSLVVDGVQMPAIEMELVPTSSLRELSTSRWMAMSGEG